MNKNSLLFLVFLAVAGFLGYKFLWDKDGNNQEANSSVQGKKEKFVFRRVEYGEPDNMHPNDVDNTWESAMFRDMCEGLMTEGPGGELIQGVAERYEISNEGKTYTFYFRDDVKWSNGDPVTAHDFLFSYRRIVNPASAVKFAWILGNIVNAEEITSGKEKNLDTLGVKVIDDSTLEITLDNPTPYFLELLTHGATCPLPKKVVEKLGKDWVKNGNHVSNGAYKLVEWKPQQYVKLEKNPHYRDFDKIEVDEVIYYPYEDRNAVLRQYLAGQIDYAVEIPSEKIPSFKKSNPGALQESRALTTYYYVINQKDKRFQDIRVRKALTLAVDRETIATKILKVGKIPHYSLAPNKITATYTAYEASYSKIPFEERVKEAKRLLAEAGYGPDNPLEFTLSYNNSEIHEKVAVSIQGMWDRFLGVKAKLSNSEVKVHYDQLKKGNFEIARAGWAADYSDPQDYLLLVAKDNVYNYGKYYNADFQKLYDESFLITDLKKRDKVMFEAEKIAIEDVALIPLFNYVEHFLINPKFEGWKFPNPKRALKTQYIRLKKNKS